MATPLITIGVSIALSAAAAVYALHVAGKQKKNTLSPQSLDSFGITQAKEGSVVPVVYGRVRLPGNIIYYGNLYTEEIVQKAEGGGKGFGSGGGGQVTGYKYYLDVWQTIAAVETDSVSLVDTYVNDNHASVEAAETLYNNGASAVSPAAYVTDANKLGSVAHVFYRRLCLGDNTTQVPTIHFIVERTLATGLPSENLANGSNPAAIIYDLLLMAGIVASEIDFASFSAAATYWAGKGYGLNLVFSEQKSLHEAINTVLAQVDGYFFINAAGKYALQAFDPSQAVTKTITTKDFYEFSLQRPAYSQLPNFLRANFVDQDQDFSERMTRPFVSDAGIQSAGRVIEKSFDLKGFRDADAAEKRLAEIGKYSVYPVAKIDFSTNFKYASLVPGDVVEVQYDDLGITSAQFRIDSVDFPGVDSLQLKFKATQVAEALFDANYAAFSGSEYSRNPITPSTEPDARAEIILPYNKITGTTPHRLFLIQRASVTDTGYVIQARAGVEPDGPPYNPGADAANGYFNVGFLQGFSQTINLSIPPAYIGDPTSYPHYPQIFDQTYDIDDQDEGITFYTSEQLDLTAWPNISRAELFTTNRFLLVSLVDESEVPRRLSALEFVAFQTIEPISSPVGWEAYYFYKIKNFLRGAFFTTKKEHAYTGPGIWEKPTIAWLFKIRENYLVNSLCGTYRVVLPSAHGKTASPADTHPFYPLSATYEANTFFPKNVWGNSRIEAIRSGSDITVKIYPANYNALVGAGLGNPDQVTDSETFYYEGNITIAPDGLPGVVKSSPDVTHSFSSAGAIDVTVSTSPGASSGVVTVGAADGTYVAYMARLFD